MRTHSFSGTTLILFAAAATAQQTAPAPPASAQIAPNERFYKTYQITPIGNGDKVVIVLDAGTQQFNIYGAEPVPAKDGGAVTQWTLSSNGFMTVYSKKSIVIPDPNGGVGTTIEGMSVVNLSSPPPSAPTVSVGHQTSSLFTTPPKKSPDYKVPIRFERVGVGLGWLRVWILWDGKREIQVQPVDTKFRNTIWTLPGFGNHMKFLSNVYTEGSPAPRYFYIKRNKDDGMTIYGDDDIEKLKAIEKGKAK